MWLSSLVHLVLMLAGLAVGSFAWASAFAGNNQYGPYWWIGGIVGLCVGWAIARYATPSVPRLAPTAPPTPGQPSKHTPAPKPGVGSEAIALLAVLQREARLVDFLQESLAGYTDAQIGAAVRDIHRDCGAVLKRLFDLRPAVDLEEGAEVEVSAGFDPTRWRLTGNVSGEPPFRGRLVHPGWEATRCDLPIWTGSGRATNHRTGGSGSAVVRSG